MNNKLSINCFSVGLFLYVNLLIGQDQKFNVGSIEHWESFMVPTDFENRIINIEKSHYEIYDHLVSVDSVFIEGTPDSIKEDHYRTELENRTHFEFNRSRWDTKVLTNDVVQDSTLIDGNLISFPCHCKISNNKIYITMGMLAFGGTLVKIVIQSDSFSASIFEDAYQTLKYKYTSQDTIWVSEIALQLTNKQLTLTSTPKFQLNELISGLLEFESPIYYSDKIYTYDIEDKTTGQALDVMQTKGKIFFTCVLPKNLK